MAYNQTVRVVEVIDVRRSPDATEDFQGDQIPFVPLATLFWADGTGDNQSDLVASDYALSITGSGSVDLDLDALARGPGGATVSFAEVRAVLVRARDTNGDAVRLEPGSSNGWTALGASLQLDLPPGLFLRIYSPVDGSLPVGASDKVLTLANQGSSAALVDICIIGVSA